MELSSLGDLKRTPFVIASYGIVAGLVRYWLSQLTKHVPEPYLDEVFHIPQAQAYCVGDFQTWNPKLTTPPGLYIFSVLILRLLPLGSNTCIVQNLRATGLVALLMLQITAHLCRRLILSEGASKAPGTASSAAIFWNAVHSAVNICLFPPIFFFSGLYYTDVLSTAVVAASYSLFLSNRSKPTILGGLGAYCLGIWALFMRQTNIFWVAVFLAGLEWVRAYLILCLASTGVAALSNPLLLAKHLWPYIALLASFGGFVAWNGGVVLGDKSNHIATIHLSQMLYIWPFFAFFSLPLLYPHGISILKSFMSVFKVPRHKITAAIPTVLWLTGSLILAVAIIHFNTIIHSFTLADNRHYVFYVFRYTIRRHPFVKYALAPIYVACGWLVILCLGGGGMPEVATLQVDLGTKDKKSSKQELQAKARNPNHPSVDQNGPSTSFVLIWLASTALSLITAPLVEPRYFIIPWVIWRLHVPLTPSVPTKSSRKGMTIIKSQDHPLWLETAWFVAINFITTYVFLFRGFAWPQEPGKVQRFMW